MLVQAGVMPDLAAEAADTVVAVQHYHTHGLVTALHKHRQIQREGQAGRRTETGIVSSLPYRYEPVHTNNQLLFRE